MNEERQEEQQGISLADLLFLVKRNIILILIITGLCAICGGVYGAFIKKPTYTSTTTCIVDVKPTGGNEPTSYNYSLILARTFAEYVVTQPVLAKAQEKLKDKYPAINKVEIKNCVSINLPTNTNILTISVTTSDEQKAIDIANAVSDAAIQCANESDTNLKDKLYNINPAYEATIKTGRLLSLVIAVLIGLVISFVIVLVKFLTDNTYTSREVFERTFKINILACLQDVESGGTEQ